jgi:hypothetical protein
MEKIIYRKNKLFCIDKSKLKPVAQKDNIYIALYAAIYTEFSGAIYNQDYSNLTSIARLDKVNEFALKWLDERGLL